MAISAVDVNDPGAGYSSSLTGQTYTSYQDAQAAEASLSNPVPAPAAPDPATGQSSGRAAASNDPDFQAKVDAATANGQVYNALTGTYRPMTDAERLDAQNVTNASAPATAPANPNGSALDTVNQVIANNRPAQTPAQSLAGSGVSRGAFTNALSGATAPGALANTGYRGNTGAVVTQATAPGSTATGNGGVPASAPVLDTSKADQSVAGVNSTISQLLNLSNQYPQVSPAEAQLLKADQLAKIRDQQSLQQNEAAALGAARSGNRRDQALLGRQAIGESAYLGQADQRNQVVQQAELEGNLATVRAQEAQTEFNQRAQILSKAADLGLNVAGLQTDISKANLGAATDYMNNEFQQLGIDKQLSQQQIQSTLSFMQGMSAIQYDYDKMSDADKQHTLDLMMSQYGIDKAEESALAQIKANKKVTWDQFLSQAALGAIGGGSAIAAAEIGKK